MDNLPAPPPEVKKNKNIFAYIMVGVVLSLIGVALVNAGQFVNGSSNENCFEPEAKEYSNNALDLFERAITASENYDVDTAAAYIRSSADEFEKSVEYIHNDEAASYLEEAIEQWRLSADDLENYEIESASAHMNAATIKMDMAVNAIDSIEEC